MGDTGRGLHSTGGSETPGSRSAGVAWMEHSPQALPGTGKCVCEGVRAPQARVHVCKGGAEGGQPTQEGESSFGSTAPALNTTLTCSKS